MKYMLNLAYEKSTLLPPPHLPGSSINVEETLPVLTDPLMHYTSVLLILKHHPKIFLFYYTKIKI
jgi:hypothetical protein